MITIKFKNIFGLDHEPYTHTFEGVEDLRFWIKIYGDIMAIVWDADTGELIIEDGVVEEQYLSRPMYTLWIQKSNSHFWHHLDVHSAEEALKKVLALPTGWEESSSFIEAVTGEFSENLMNMGVLLPYAVALKGKIEKGDL